MPHNTVKKHFLGKTEVQTHTHSLTFPPTCTTLTALLCFPLTHATWCPVPSSSSLNSAPSCTCSASLPPACLYLSLASPNPLQAYTHCQLFLLLSHSDLAGEHSCPATIPPHGLFCFRPFPLSRSATTLHSLPFPSFLSPHPLFLPGLVCLQYVPILILSLHKRGSYLFPTEKPPLLELPPYWS